MNGQHPQICHSGSFNGDEYADNAFMAQNQIKQLRQARGMTVDVLADLTGISQPHLSRIENGKRGLSVDNAEKIAMVLSKTVPEVMGLTNGQRSEPIMTGFAEDAERYVPEPNSLLGHALKRQEHAYAYVVKTGVLDQCGVTIGDILIVDVSSEAVEAIKPMQLVVAQHYHPDPQVLLSTTIIRQFVPPSLLITNSKSENERPLIRDEEAVIKGVVTDIHRRMRT